MTTPSAPSPITISGTKLSNRDVELLKGALIDQLAVLREGLHNLSLVDDVAAIANDATDVARVARMLTLLEQVVPQVAGG